jgi:hypothetical protein
MLCAISIETKFRQFCGVLSFAFYLAKRGVVFLVGEKMAGRIVHDSKESVLSFDNDHTIADNTSILESGGNVISIHPERLDLIDIPKVQTKVYQQENSFQTA